MNQRKEITWEVRADGCHICTSHALNMHGYPKIKRNGKAYHGNRLVYEMHNGPIPDGMVVRHTCDNPPCINPDHLLIGTHQDNMRDKMNRGRCGAASKLTKQEVREIKQSKLPARALAEQFAVHVTTIFYIRAGKIWSHVTA